MTLNILLAGVVILFCVLLNKFTHRFGLPMLLAFILLGMAFGSDGILKIPFEDYRFAEQICSIALIFIMFYGGFGTRWREAKPVALKSILLSTIGVAFTAVLTGLFCRFALGIALWESMLIGAVISSTDAASVFSILRSKKLGLKNGTDSMLELESGSNDPCSYMLTIIVLSALGEGISPGSVFGLLLAQFGFGIFFGVTIALGAAYFMRHFRFATEGFDLAFVIGIALLSYASAASAGGNGYLSAYLCGIIFGNQRLKNQKALVHFFDGITGLMQMLIFFLLGLLATPSRIPQVFLPALGIMLFLTFIARPVGICSILSLFRCSARQQLLVSFAGLRGAASIVFAIMAIVSQPDLSFDLYHIVFCIVLLSIAFQGTFLPLCAKRLQMTDSSIDVMKTFSDYSEESAMQCIKVRMTAKHPWIGRPLQYITLPPDTLIILLLREGQRMIPDGKTEFQENDEVVLSAFKYDGRNEIPLKENMILPGSHWIGRTIQEFSPDPGELVIMLIRNDQAILPKGSTVLSAGDMLVILSEDMADISSETV